ncbi:M122/m123 ie3 protein [Murid betaherpesvirus 1]|nr:M122/m123 ie3 protein [Murid betaherpesvirus 1]
MEPAAPSCNMIMIADQASVNAHGRHLDENRVYPSDKVPAHVANKILESGTEPVRCDLTLEDMLGDYEYDDPTEEEKILMDRIADHVGNDNSDMAIKHAAGPEMNIDIVTAAASMSGITTASHSALPIRRPNTPDFRRHSEKKAKKHKNKQRQRLDEVVAKLHKPSESEADEDFIFQQPQEDEYQEEQEPQVISSSPQHFDERSPSRSSSDHGGHSGGNSRDGQFYLSSGSEDEDDEDDERVDSGYRGSSRSEDSSRYRPHGGSHSSRSSIKSSGSGSSRHHHKRKAVPERHHPFTPPSAKRYAAAAPSSRYECPVRVDSSDSDDAPTMVQRGTLKIKSFRPPSSGSNSNKHSSSSGGSTSSSSHKKQQQQQAPSKKPVSSGSDKIRDMVDRTAGGYVAPNAHKKCREDKSRKYPARALEYKNLPFRPQSPQYLLGKAIQFCKEETVHDKFIMLFYTRSQDVRKAVDETRARMGMRPNLSISCPFMTEHTKPINHSRETIDRTSAACTAGTQAVWDMEERRGQKCVPRTSDYRSMIIQAANPPDFLGAVKTCLHLSQVFPKQVCMRLCSITGGLNPLPIYEETVNSYVNAQFEADDISHHEDESGEYESDCE